MNGKHSRMCNSKDMLKNQIAFVVSPCTEKNQAYSSTVAVDLHILCHHSEDSSLVYIWCTWCSLHPPGCDSFQSDMGSSDFCNQNHKGSNLCFLACSDHWFSGLIPANKNKNIKQIKIMVEWNQTKNYSNKHKKKPWPRMSPSICMYCLLTPQHPNIRMHILHTVLYTFSRVLKMRICFTIKSFLS